MNRVAGGERTAAARVLCSSEILRQISATICERGVRSLRADLAAMRASVAYAALMGDSLCSRIMWRRCCRWCLLTAPGIKVIPHLPLRLSRRRP